MTQTTRAWIGFVVAPVVPGLLLYIFNIFMGFGDAAVVGPLILIPLGYVAALIIGVPVHIVLQRKNIRSFFAYLVSGALIGLVFYVLFTAISSYPGQFVDALMLSLGPFLMASGYAAMAAALFWVIAVGRQDRSSVTK